MSALQLSQVTGKTYRCVYRGWEVIAVGLKGGVASDGITYKPNELVTIIPDKKIDPKAPLLRVVAGVVFPRSCMTKVKEIR
jgi:hypothetical protein